MTDKELLELAAKAAAITCSWAHADEADYSASTEGMWRNGERSPNNSKFWNPLTDDGDSLRLAVKLGMDVCIDTPQENEPGTHAIAFVGSGADTVDAVELHGSDPYAATRRAIVRAAAAIGKAMP